MTKTRTGVCTRAAEDALAELEALRDRLKKAKGDTSYRPRIAEPPEFIPGPAVNWAVYMVVNSPR